MLQKTISFICKWVCIYRYFCDVCTSEPFCECVQVVSVLYYLSVYRWVHCNISIIYQVNHFKSNVSCCASSTGKTSAFGTTVKYTSSGG